MIEAFENIIGRRPTLPHTRACSTIGAEELNFRVRDGNGWDLLATTTQSWLVMRPTRLRALGCRLRQRPLHHNLGDKNHIDGTLDTQFKAIKKLEVRNLLYVKGKFYGQAERAISSSQLNVLLRLHICPINVVVFHGPS